MTQGPMLPTLLRIAPLAAALLLGSCSGGGGGGGSSGDFALESINVQANAVWKINRPIVLEFNQPVDFSTVNLNTINIRRVGGGPSAGEFYLKSPTVVAFQPRCPILDDLSDAGLQPGGVRYELNVLGIDQNVPLTVRSQSGKSLKLSDTRLFTTPVSLLAADLFFDPVVGAPVPVVRTDAPGDVLEEATYLEIGGDPDQRHYFERNVTSGAISLDPPLTLPLNLQSLQPSQVALVLRINQPVDASSDNINSTQLPWQYRDQVGLWRPLSTQVTLETNCAEAGAIVRIQPLGILPPDTDLRAVITQEFRDIVGETNLLQQDTFAPANTSPAPVPLVDEYLERFATQENYDATATFAEPHADWGNQGTLRAQFSFTGSGGPNGDFDWRIPQGTTVLFNTDTQTILGGPNFSQSVGQTVIGGIIDVRNMRVEAGATLAFIGPNPVKIFASGTVEILGRISVNGTNNNGVNTLNTTNIPEPGAPGQAGGGKGGTGSPLVTASSPKGGNGFGAFNVADAGGLGGETGWNNEGLSQLNKRRGAGGGGGVLGHNQLNQFPATPPTGTFDQTFIGLDAEPGFPNLTLGALGAISGAGGPQGGAAGASPFTDPDATNDFYGSQINTTTLQVTLGELLKPWAGAGGGGGGDASFVGIGATFPQSPFNPAGDEKGSGGGGGAGGLHILALGNIIFGANGRITARGGWGGGGENTSFLNRIGGGSGAGSGGHVVLETAGRVDMSQVVLGAPNTFDAVINACGGQGGAGAQNVGGASGAGQSTPVGDACPSGYPTTGNNACKGHTDGAGGDGGPGIIQLHTANGLAPVNPDILLPAGQTLATLCKPKPLSDTNASRFVPGFGRTSRARSEWFSLGEGGFDITSATPKNVVFEFEGTDPLTGLVLTSGSQVISLPTLFAPVTVVAAPGVPHITPNGSTLVIDPTWLPQEYQDNHGLLRDQLIELSDLVAPSNVARFTIQTVEAVGATLELTVSSDGPSLNTFQGTAGIQATVRKAFFRVISSGAPDALPGSATVQITFQAAKLDAQGNLLPVGSFVTDVSTLNALPDNRDLRFVRFEVLFDIDAGNTGLTPNNPIPALQFVRLPFRYN